MYIACLCPSLVSVHFYAIPILHFKFPNFLFTCIYICNFKKDVCVIIRESVDSLSHSMVVLCI